MKTKQFKISKVLQWQSQKEIDPLKIKELTVEGDFSYPFYGQATINNGIISYETLNSSVLNNIDGKPTILIHSNNQNIVYLETPFYLKDGHGATSVLQAEWLNERNALYIIASIKKVITKKFAYNEKATKIALKNTYIELPIKNKKLDLEYMENYIYKLEKGCINDLNTTLSSEGIIDTTISEEELSFLNQPPRTQPKKLEELFVSETGDVDLQQKDIDGKGEYFVNSGLQNYGIKGRTSRPAKIFNSNTITIDFFGNAYYRAFKYKMATHNHVFSLSGDIIKNEKVGLYLVSQMFYFKKVFSYNEMATWNKIKKLTLNIPITSNGFIDYDYMERYISIIEKMTLKNVTDWEKLNY